MGDDYSVAVFGSLQQMRLPLVCCLCASHFVASYSWATDDYVLTPSDEKWGVSVDVKTQRAFDWTGYSNSFTLYDLEDGSSKEFSPDLSGADAYGLLSIWFHGALLFAVLF